MIYLADENLLAAVRSSWGVVALDVDKWIACFPDQPKDRVAAWWKRLVTPDGYRGSPVNAVKFSLPEINQKDVKHPAVLAKMVNSPITRQYLGDSDGDGLGSVSTTPRVRVSCVAWKRDLAIALGMFAIQAIYTNKGVICTETNAENITLLSAGEARPEPELMPELGGAYVFALEYAVEGFVSLVEVGAIAQEALGFSINDISAEDAEGNIGRVNPGLVVE